MKLRLDFLILFAAVTIINAEVAQNYIGREIQKCINCLCHARSGCWSRFNCAAYSVDIDYWRTAGSPTVDVDDSPDDESSYKKCMANENCIVASIAQYTERFGEIDCNCDGVFDCKDRFAIHIKGENCLAPVFGNTYARRFNQCADNIGVATMLTAEGTTDCDVEVL